MACVQPLGLPLQDIVGTGFEHEGTERNRLAKQGWKEGDLGKGDFNVENEFEKEMNPVVIDYDGDDNNDKSVKGKEDKEDANDFRREDDDDEVTTLVLLLRKGRKNHRRYGRLRRRHHRGVK